MNKNLNRGISQGLGARMADFAPVIVTGSTKAESEEDTNEDGDLGSFIDEAMGEE